MRRELTTTDAMELLGLQHSLRRIAHATEVHSRRIDREFGLTLPQVSVLSCVQSLGAGAHSRAIAAAAHLSPPTVVGILDKLEAKGMIRRERSALDRRVVHTTLTDAGARALRAVPVPSGRQFQDAFMALDEAVRAGILSAFAQVAEMMEAPAIPATPPMSG